MASWTYIDGQWQSGNPPILGPMSHAMWQASLVFDGARAFEGTTPDLDRHCARAVASARLFGLDPMLSPGEVEDIAREGLGHFARDAELYIRPMFWAEEGFLAGDPASTRFALAIYDKPMPRAGGFSASLSRFRRPSPETAPTEAKAACLYPMGGRAMVEAQRRGFDNAVMLDPLGHVAEFASSNLFFVKDGTVVTPEPNGTFLAGITRQRVIRLLRQARIEVQERAVGPDELLTADEIFSTGNLGKVQPVVRYEDRELEPGPMFRQARMLYWSFAHGQL